MLRRVDNVQVFHKKGLFSKIGRTNVRVGKSVWEVGPKITPDEFYDRLADSEDYPVSFITVDSRKYWLFKDRWYWDNDGLNADQIHALLVARDRRSQETINRARSMVAMAQQPSPTARRGIPDDLKQYVWTRDEGACTQCRSNVELQFDHIIPVAYGGASTAENLQILCGPCNRRKGASVV